VHAFDLLGHHIYEQTLSTCFLKWLILWDLEDSEFVMLRECVSILICVNTDIKIASFQFYVSKSGCLLSYIPECECEYLEVFLLLAHRSTWDEGTEN